VVLVVVLVVVVLVVVVGVVVVLVVVLVVVVVVVVNGHSVAQTPAFCVGWQQDATTTQTRPAPQLASVLQGVALVQMSPVCRQVWVPLVLVAQEQPGPPQAWDSAQALPARQTCGNAVVVVLVVGPAVVVEVVVGGVVVELVVDEVVDVVAVVVEVEVVGVVVEVVVGGGVVVGAAGQTVPNAWAHWGSLRQWLLPLAKQQQTQPAVPPQTAGSAAQTRLGQTAGAAARPRPRTAPTPPASAPTNRRRDPDWASCLVRASNREPSIKVPFFDALPACLYLR